MATPPEYRYALRRSHRLVACYLALWAWHHGIDCIALPRGELLPFLRLKRMRDQRVDWLKTDIKDLFPYAWTTVDSTTNAYATLYLSRKPIPADAKKGKMRDVERVDKLTKLGLPAAMANIPKESDMLGILGSMFHGIGEIPKDSI